MINIILSTAYTVYIDLCMVYVDICLTPPICVILLKQPIFTPDEIGFILERVNTSYSYLFSLVVVD